MLVGGVESTVLPVWSHVEQSSEAGPRAPQLSCLLFGDL